MKTGIFISAGLGDAVLMVPLIKKLKALGSVTGLFDSPFQCHELFKGGDLFDDIIVLDSHIAYLKTWIKYSKQFDIVFLNYFSAKRTNLFLSLLLSDEVRLNKESIKLLRFGKQKIKAIKPIPEVHESIQNLRLFDPSVSIEQISELDFSINHKKQLSQKEQQVPFEQPYITIQICSANNRQQHKNWPINYWSSLLKLLTQQYPKLQFIIIGDKNEAALAEQALKGQSDKVSSVAGKTSVSNLIQVIGNSLIFIGLDGGPMHIAASQGIPTFTIWGGSNYNMYGYQNINKERHKIVFKKLACHPCNSWINPNTSKITDPNKCPDFECLNSLTPEFVFSQLEPFVNHILTSK